MELVIGKKKSKKVQPKNKFKFKIELMGGDADAWFYPTLLIDKDNPYLDRFLNFLDNCKKEYPSGKGGYDDYRDVEDYWLFCGDEFPEEILVDEEWIEVTDEMIEEFEKEIEKCNIRFDWEGSYEAFGISSFRGFEVSYFDESGDEFKVKVKK